MTDLPTDDPVNEAGPKYPVTVQLTGQDGNAFFILGRVQAGLRRAGVPEDEVNAYYAEATAGDYGHLLRTTMRWVEVI